MTNAFGKIVMAGILILMGYFAVSFLVMKQAKGYYEECKDELRLPERYNAAFADKDYDALDAEYAGCVEKKVTDVGLFFYSKNTIIKNVNREGIRKRYERGRIN